MAVQKRRYLKIMSLLIVISGSVNICMLMYVGQKPQGTLNTKYDMEERVTAVFRDVDTAMNQESRRHVAPALDGTTNTTKQVSFPITLYAPYLIENRTLCSSVQDLSVIVIVHTAPGHTERRNTIRTTWTNETYFRHLGRVRVLFLLGRVKDENVQQNIRSEFAQFGDLLQGDFIDSYRNLTHKGVMAYKWLTERCRNAKLVLKVDDDVVINTYELLTMYHQILTRRSKHILCNRVLPGNVPIQRQNTSKWHVDESEFGGKFYPPYCSGFTVLFTNDVIPALYKAAAVTPFLWVDDVYLYGLVTANVPGIEYTSFKREYITSRDHVAIECYTNITRTCNFIVVGTAERSTAHTIWSFMTKAYNSKAMVSIS